MEKIIYFHVGLEKCGSTLIQAYMNEPHVQSALRNKLGLRHNIDVVTTDFRNTPASADQLRLTLFNPDRAEKGMFATQESFTWFTHDKAVPDRHEEMLEKLKDLTRDYVVHPLIIVRRQHGFIESLYNQAVKKGETRDFAAFFNDLPLERYDWNIVCDLYANTFGADKLTVLPLEPACYKPVRARNFLEGVLRTIGLKAIRVDPFELAILNPSLAPRTVEIQRLANQMLPPHEAEWLAGQLAFNLPKHPGDKHDLLTDAMAADLNERYREANRKLFETYMPDFDGAPYFK